MSQTDLFVAQFQVASCPWSFLLCNPPNTISNFNGIESTLSSGKECRRNRANLLLLLTCRIILWRRNRAFLGEGYGCRGKMVGPGILLIFETLYFRLYKGNHHHHSPMGKESLHWPCFFFYRMDIGTWHHSHCNQSPWRFRFHRRRRYQTLAFRKLKHLNYSWIHCDCIGKLRGILNILRQSSQQIWMHSNLFMNTSILPRVHLKYNQLYLWVQTNYTNLRHLMHQE